MLGYLMVFLVIGFFVLGYDVELVMGKENYFVFFVRFGVVG